jgi:acyl-CoA thioesterase
LDSGGVVTVPEERPSAPFLELVGAQVEERGEGYVRITLTVEARHLNPHGVMHGGVAMTLMDSAAASALSSLRGQAEVRRNPHASVDMHVAFLAPARVGDEIVAEGRIIKFGKSIAFAEAEVRRKSDNELIATGRVTFAISTERA